MSRKLEGLGRFDRAEDPPSFLVSLCIFLSLFLFLGDSQGSSLLFRCLFLFLFLLVVTSFMLAVFVLPPQHRNGTLFSALG